MNSKECAAQLAAHNHYIILTHRNPDGDTIGSAGALCHALRRMGKTAWLYRNEQYSEKQLRFIGAYVAPAGLVYDHVIAVDIASESQLPKGYEGGADWCIDHHPSNTFYAGSTLLQADKAACAQIVLQVIRELTGSVTPEEATLLYIGLSTDCGCFQYGNTNAKAFRDAAELLDAGAENYNINELFFRKITRARMKLEGMVYSGMRYFFGGRVVVAIVTKAMINDAQATQDDCDDLAALAGKAEGAQLCITIKESDTGTSRISLRSGPEINSSEICARFGGGGHAMAAGCGMDCPPEEACERLMSVIKEILGE